MRENQIISAIKAFLKSIPNCYSYKTHGGFYGSAGLPDIICCIGGAFVAFEVKTDIGKTTALQEACIRKIIQAGGTAEVVRSVDDVRAVVEKLTGGESK
ncbi:MAG: VRR-NUC domain-containing protein [Firmicutes bacterium]|nr:VRR-NUC domain-containing protein [Bacillota bacterium]